MEAGYDIASVSDGRALNCQDAFVRSMKLAWRIPITMFRMQNARKTRQNPSI